MYNCKVVNRCALLYWWLEASRGSESVQLSIGVARPETGLNLGVNDTYAIQLVAQG